MAQIENPICLTYLNGTGYVFDIDDYMKLRTEFRIIGSFVGTCNARGWTPGVNGLPAQLNQYETQLLLEKGHAILLNKTSSLLKPPTDSEIEKYKESLDNRILEQEEFLKEEKLQQTKKHIQKILAGRIKKTNNSNLTENDILNEVENNFKFNKENALLEIPCKHILQHDGSVVKLNIGNSLKYKAFKFFWEKGKYITSGENFGADFIIYPGDPIMFHASHIVIVLDDSSVKLIEVIAKCRLSVMVNKKCVFVYYNAKNELSWQIIEWENLSKIDK